MRTRGHRSPKRDGRAVSFRPKRATRRRSRLDEVGRALPTEDGGVIYFAKTVEVGPQPVSILTPGKIKGKIYQTAEIKAKLEKDFGKNPWGKAAIRNLFGLW